MVVGIKDIAAYLGLSTSTVSRALNAYEDVAPETARRVEEAARALGYYPSASARNLRRRRTGKIGLALLYDAAFATFNEFFAELIRLIAAAIEREDYNLVLYTRAGESAAKLMRIAQAREVDGLLLLGDAPWQEQVQDDLLAAGLPFAHLHRTIADPRVSFITADNRAGGRLAARHLIELGHRRIGYLGFTAHSRSSLERLTGLREALEEAGLRYDPALVAHASLEPGSGARAALSLLDLPVPPTAIFAFNDRLAMEALLAISERGLHVPHDVAVVGFDDIRSSRMTVPPLTTIHQPLEVIAEQAVRALLAGGAGDGVTTPLRLVIPVELVVRGSTVAEHTAASSAGLRV
jgi:LacI family transcriptional regulator